MNRDHLVYLGAKQRQKELAEEVAQLERFIRDYERRTGVTHPRSRGASAGETARGTRRRMTVSRGVRRRKPMSAAQRKAVSDRMRRYWAARRAATTGKKR